MRWYHNLRQSFCQKKKTHTHHHFTRSKETQWKQQRLAPTDSHREKIAHSIRVSCVLCVAANESSNDRICWEQKQHTHTHRNTRRIRQKRKFDASRSVHAQSTWMGGQIAGTLADWAYQLNCTAETSICSLTRVANFRQKYARHFSLFRIGSAENIFAWHPFPPCRHSNTEWDKQNAAQVKTKGRK